MLKKFRNFMSSEGRLFFSLAVIFVFAVASQVSAAAKNSNDKNITPKARPTLTKTKTTDPGQQLLVRFKEGTASSTKSSLHRTLGTNVKKLSRTVPGLQVIKVSPGTNADMVLKQYQKDPSVLYAEPDSRIRLKAIPNDTSFSQLWGLNNTGLSGGAVDADINAPQAWDITQGDNNVVVAVVDTGIEYSHIDLVGNIWTNPGEIAGNGIDDDGNGYIDDIHGIDTGDGDSDPLDVEGHGTHVAGTIGARGNNNLGVSGVNWNVTIIGCKIFSSTVSQNIEAFVSDAVECLDYLYDLKMNRGIDITATNNSWGWIGNPSQTLIDAIDRQRQAGILFMAAAGNDSLNTDQFLDNPSGYYLPNIISIAASTRTDGLADFSNYGRRTVHVAAPGHEILSTVPDTAGGGFPPPVVNPHDEIFLDNVESGAGIWGAQSPWSRTSASSYSASNSWTDSPSGNYSNNINTTLTSTAVDLSSYAGQSVYVGFYANYQIETGFDNLYIEVSNNSVSWIELGSFTGNSSGWKFFSYTIPQAYLTGTFRIRFRFQTDSSVTDDGVYIDDIGIGTTLFVPEPVVGSSSYDTLSGTSMATPHVVGLAALLKAQNGTRTWQQIKNLIISSGTPRAAFSGNTVSGRRIRAYDTNNTGGMTCSNQTVLARLQPRTDEYAIEPGDLVNVSMLHINCGEPAGAVSVTVADTGDTVDLLDNGLGYDQVAGDGIYSAQINLGALGLQSADIQFPDATVVHANTIYNYQSAVVNAYQWRDISGVGQPLFAGNPTGMPYDDDTTYLNTPFGIPFGNISVPYTRLAIDTNGYIVMQWIGEPPVDFSIYENFEIPLVGLTNIVAVFWDDLVFDNDPSLPNTNVYWGVLGTAPNRELVITWQNARPFLGNPDLTFQVVFSESSSDVIVNYQDTVIPDSLTDNGISATSGVQIAPSIGDQFSYNTALLTSNSSVRWSMPTGVVNNPLTSPPVFRATPGGGGGSFGLMLAVVPLLVFGYRIFKRPGNLH